MNKITLILTLIFFAAAKVAAQQGVFLADPFIMLHEGKYYAYGTFSERGIEVHTSDDLIQWKKHYKLALDRNDSWGERWFWAPEVYHIKGRFYMYYCSDEHICMAASDSPLGPFVPPAVKPVIENEKTLDPSLFMDDTGKAYLFFARLNGDTGIWMAELTANMQGIKPGTMNKCLSVSEEWEKIWPNIIQGPYVFRHGDTYYMLYYANSHASQNCGIGYATAPNPWGPWKKHPSNPILRKPGSLVGTGQCSLFTDRNGDTRIVFHSHYDNRNIDPRRMYISRLRFRKTFKGDVISIDKSFTTPVPQD